MRHEDLLGLMSRESRSCWLDEIAHSCRGQEGLTWGEGTDCVCQGQGDRDYVPCLEGSFLCHQCPKEQRFGQRGLPPNKMFPEIRQAWIWPAPGHQHTAQIAFRLKEGVMWTHGYSGTKGYKQAVLVP